MFTKTSAANEVALAMELSLISKAEEETFGLSKIAQAVDHLNSAADIFDDVGLSSEAEYLTNLIEVLAKKSEERKSKKSSKPVKKKTTKTESKSEKKDSKKISIKEAAEVVKLINSLNSTK